MFLVLFCQEAYRQRGLRYTGKEGKAAKEADRKEGFGVPSYLVLQAHRLAGLAGVYRAFVFCRV